MCSVISLQLSKRKERRNPSFLLFSFFESNQLYSSALGLLSFTNHIYKQTENVDGIFSSLNSTLLQSRLTIDNNSSEWMSELSGNLWWLIHHGSIQKDGRDRWTDFFLSSSNYVTATTRLFPPFQTHIFTCFLKDQKMENDAVIFKDNFVVFILLVKMSKPFLEISL